MTSLNSLVSMSSDCTLDLSLLERARKAGPKLVARCPACAELGGDRKGHHLVIWPSGKFACAACPGDSMHRQRVFALAGIARARSFTEEQKRQWRMRRNTEAVDEEKWRRLAEAAVAGRSAIIARHQWSQAEVWENSPQRIDSDSVEFDPRHFLSSLFPSKALLWTGEVHESGQQGRHADRWQACATWQALPHEKRIGPMTTPAIWKTATVSRAGDQVLHSPYSVLDFDEMDGAKPKTPDQLRQHVANSLAVIRWIRECLKWRLAAILWTGGKSLHAWFHSPGEDALQSLRATAQAWGVDRGLIGRPEHPCRLPGHPHARTGNRSRVLWLQLPPYPSDAFQSTSAGIGLEVG